MVLHEIINKEYDTKDDLVVDLANAVKEVDELISTKEKLIVDKENLEREVVKLKSSNLELLSMIPKVSEIDTDPDTNTEIIKKEDVMI